MDEIKTYNAGELNQKLTEIVERWASEKVEDYISGAIFGVELSKIMLDKYSTVAHTISSELGPKLYWDDDGLICKCPVCGGECGSYYAENYCTVCGTRLYFKDERTAKK